MTVSYAKKQQDKKGVNNGRWMHWSALFCAALLAANSLTFYTNELSLVISDIASGVIIAVLAIFGLTGKCNWIRWPMALTAVWLFFAPLIFWAKSPAAYQTETTIGAVLIVIYWIVGVKEKTTTAAHVPPGWSYNPSSWSQRIPLIGLALIGFFISRYLTSYQLGYIATAWDPMFPGGTDKVLSSEISKAFIISDAGLGAVSYLVDALAGAIGGTRRWQTMPWMVLLFGILVVPPGVVSIVLVVLQPLGVGAWCSLCLIASMSMLLMVPLAFDEIVATVQYLARAKSKGHSLWKTIFRGTDIYTDEDTPLINSKPETVPSNFPPVSLLLSLLLSIWLLAAPYFTGSSGQAALYGILAGAVAATIAVTAFAEVSRSVRFLNVITGLGVLASSFTTGGYSQLGMINSILVGVLLIGLSLPKGRIVGSYGSWNKYIR